MKYTHEFLYLSEILGLPLKDSLEGSRIGKIADLSANLSESYPKIIAVIVAGPKHRKFYIPWSAINKFDIKKKNIVADTSSMEDFESHNIPENEALLNKLFFDKQVINISGAKVVRVNDLHFLRENLCLWLVHFDVGIKGLLRRLGMLSFWTFISEKIFGKRLEDGFIRWKDSQLLPEPNAYGERPLKLIANKLSEVHPADLADILGDLGTEDRMSIFNTFDVKTAAETLQEVAIPIRIQISEQLEPQKFAEIINEMEPDEVADLVDKLPDQKVDELFAHLSVEKVDQIKELLGYSLRVAGSIMNPEFIATRKSYTVSQILKHIREKHRETESIYYIYVTDEDGTLYGLLSLRDLLLSPGSAKAGAIMLKNVVSININTRLKKVAEVFFKYNFSVIPIVDDTLKIKGVINIKDALEAVFPEIRKETEG